MYKTCAIYLCDQLKMSHNSLEIYAFCTIRTHKKFVSLTKHSIRMLSDALALPFPDNSINIPMTFVPHSSLNNIKTKSMMHCKQKIFS